MEIKTIQVKVSKKMIKVSQFGEQLINECRQDYFLFEPLYSQSGMETWSGPTPRPTRGQ